MMTFLLAMLATPVVTVLDTGTVEGRVLLPLSVEALRKRLEDPQFLPGVSGDGTKVTVAGSEGSCLLIDAVSPSAVVELRYRVKRCPTANGFRNTLVQSAHFDAYTSELILEPQGASTLFRYRLALDPSFPVPDMVVNSGSKGGIEKLLRGLEAWAQANPGG